MVMSFRSASFLLGVLAAITGLPAAMAQRVIAPAPPAVTLSVRPRGGETAEGGRLLADTPAPPAPATADHLIEDLYLPEGGKDAPAADPQPKKQKIPLEATWDNGLRFESTDDRFHLHVGGIGQIDTVWLAGPQSVFLAPGGASNGVGNAQATQLRRTVLQVDGTIFGQFDFMLQYDFANASNDNSGLEPASFSNLTSSPAPHNIWMQISDLPYVGNIRIGNQHKPIGMVNNTSGAFLPFMERPDVHDAFYGPFDNGFALGIASWNWSESER